MWLIMISSNKFLVSLIIAIITVAKCPFCMSSSELKALTAQDIRILCNGDGIHVPPDLLSDLSKHGLNLDRRLNITRIRLRVSDELEMGSFVFYLPQDSSGLQFVLQRLSEDLIIHDENRPRPNKWHKVHFVCIPEASDDLPIHSDNLDVQIPINEHVILISGAKNNGSSSNNDDSVDMWELYSLGKRIVICQPLYNVFTRINGVTILDTTSLLNSATRRQDLHGFKIKAVAQSDERYDKLFEWRNGTLDFRSVDAVRHLWDFQLMLNFTYEAVEGAGWPRRYVTDAASENDTEFGLAGQIMKKEADICIVPSYLSIFRAQLLFYLPPMGYAVTSVFYQWRTTFVAEHGLLLMPFSGELWSMTLISAAAILCSITILAATVKSANHGKKRGSVGSMVIDTIGILVCQGACSRVKQIPLRIVFLTAGLICSVLYMSYSGAFVASVSTPVKPLTTLRELDRFNFTVFTDPEFIQNYGRGIAKNKEGLAYLKANSERLYSGKMDMVEKVLNRKERYAVVYRRDNFFGAAYAAKNISKWRLCELAAIPTERVSRVPESLSMRKGSPLKEIFTQKNVILIERGLVHLYGERMAKNLMPPCGWMNWNFYKKIDAAECFFAYGILCGGLALAALSFVGEKLLWTQHSSSSRSSEAQEPVLFLR